MTASPFDEEHDMTLTHDPGDDLRPLLATAVSDRPAATDLLAGVHRARRGRRMLVRAGSLVTAGALAAAVLTVWSVGNAPSAQAQLVAAVANTSGQAFHVHSVSKASGRVWEGAFDPAAQTGRLTETGGGQDLFVGGTVYHENAGYNAQTLPAGKHWVSEPLPTEAEWAQIGAAGEVLKRSVLNPQLVLQRLRSATNVQETGSASGAGWTGSRYSFTIKNDKADFKGGSLAITGTVDVDSQDLVRALDLTVRPDGPVSSADPKGGENNGENNVVIEFSDYGTTVDVTAPPADQVVSRDEVEQLGKGPDKGAPSDQAANSVKPAQPPSGEEPRKPGVSKSPGA